MSKSQLRTDAADACRAISALTVSCEVAVVTGSCIDPDDAVTLAGLAHRCMEYLEAYGIGTDEIRAECGGVTAGFIRRVSSK